MMVLHIVFGVVIVLLVCMVIIQTTIISALRSDINQLADNQEVQHRNTIALKRQIHRFN